MTIFLLAGNGSFRNHGCEAIARGTIEILRRTFGASIQIRYAAHDSKQTCIEDVSLLGYDNVDPIPFFVPLTKYSRMWFEYQSNRFLNTSFGGALGHLQSSISECGAALAIGGDNYSLDYGYPERFVQFDRLVLGQRKPLVYWCSSVGPFSADQKYEQRMKAHFGRVTAILARESGTVGYLRSLGITDNVHLVADPGFVMQAVRPDAASFVLDQNDFIGINFSTTVGRLLLQDHRESDPTQYAKVLRFLDQSAEYEQVCRRYAEITIALINRYGENIVFVPHVTGGPHCDYEFMNRIAELVESYGYPQPVVAPNHLTAPEYKWIISQARLFIGARTHSTIAAFSSGVPTISLAYSLKARGLTQDMYGTDSFCLPGKDAAPESILRLVEKLLEEEKFYREKVQQQSEVMVQRAWMAGEILSDLVG